MFGENPRAYLLLGCLGVTRAMCGRYRDAYIDGEHIVIHTRNGGGNRTEYQGVLDALAKHPCYVKNEDDSYDCTYANVYFSFPEKFASRLKEMAEKFPDIKPSEKWKLLLAELEK